MNSSLLRPPNSPLFSEGASLAFGIKKSSERQLHVALIYGNDDGDPWLLHLKGHEDLGHERWDQSFHWIEFIGLPLKVQELFADWAVMVAGNGDANPIPYSIILSAERNFAFDGTFISQDDGKGLTCATFLLKMFEDYGLPLADIDSWPRGRLSDIKWATKLLQFLCKKFPGSHFSLQLERVFKIRRVRPEEVIGIPGIYRGHLLKHSELQHIAKVCVATLG